MNQATATVAVWAAPVAACWTTGNPWVALAFVLSLFATIAIWIKT